MATTEIIIIITSCAWDNKLPDFELFTYVRPCAIRVGSKKF